MSIRERRSMPDVRHAFPGWLLAVCAIFIAVGVAGLAAGFAVAPPDAWLWLLVGFLIFTGTANGMLAWAAAFRVAQTRWVGAVNRIGHSALAVVPVLAVVLAALLAGVEGYLPWVKQPAVGKVAWLNVPFFVTREAVGLGLFWFLCFMLVRWSLAADARARRGDEITPEHHYLFTAIGVAITMFYAIISTIVSYDFIMSLSPRWVSTVFGAYYFCTNLYLALGVIVLLCAAMRRRLGVEEYLKPQQFHDLGNLMLAFSLFNMGLFFAQYLTIWYENLPEEVFFLIVRYDKGVWPPIGWTSFVVGYAIPFLLLQSRRIKTSYRLLSAVSALVVVGVSLERYVLVVPSIHPSRPMLYPVSVLSLLAFLGVFVLAVTAFLTHYSPVSAADEALREVSRPEEI